MRKVLMFYVAVLVLAVVGASKAVIKGGEVLMFGDLYCVLPDVSSLISKQAQADGVISSTDLFRDASVGGAIIYSPTRGIYIARGMIHPDIVRIFSIDGACLARYSGPGAGDFSWKPRTHGMYLVKIRAGKDAFAAKIICKE